MDSSHADYEDEDGNISFSPPPNEFTIAWFCPIEVEQEAAIAAMDEIYGYDGDVYAKYHGLKNDWNIYNLGKIDGHNIVICRPADERAGPEIAGPAWQDFERNFPNIQHLLIVGL